MANLVRRAPRGVDFAKGPGEGVRAVGRKIVDTRAEAPKGLGPDGQKTAGPSDDEKEGQRKAGRIVLREGSLPDGRDARRRLGKRRQAARVEPGPALAGRAEIYVTLVSPAKTSRKLFSPASRFSMISSASSSGSGRLSRSVRLLSLSQNTSRLVLSRAFSSS